jgi:hypothetical protein
MLLTGKPGFANPEIRVAETLTARAIGLLPKRVITDTRK